MKFLTYLMILQTIFLCLCNLKSFRKNAKLKIQIPGKELTPETKPVTKNENNIETHSQVLSHSSQQTEQVFPTSSITSSSNDNFISSNVPPIGQTNKPTDVSIPNLQDILKKKRSSFGKRTK